MMVTTTEAMTVTISILPCRELMGIDRLCHTRYHRQPKELLTNTDAIYTSFSVRISPSTLIHILEAQEGGRL